MQRIDMKVSYILGDMNLEIITSMSQKVKKPVKLKGPLIGEID